MVPLSFVGLNILESYIVTPMVLGHRLTLNPVVIFLGLTFWGWLWGITGALLAVPIMVVFKIFCDHSEPLRAARRVPRGLIVLKVSSIRDAET